MKYFVIPHMILEITDDTPIALNNNFIDVQKVIVALQAQVVEHEQRIADLEDEVEQLEERILILEEA